jgi:hypothetical protein
VAALMMDDELSDMDIQAELFDVATEWMKGRKVPLWSTSLYQERLSWSAERVETERMMLEMFAEDAKKSH